jgi:hypothetical protein
MVGSNIHQYCNISPEFEHSIQLKAAQLYYIIITGTSATAIAKLFPHYLSLLHFFLLFSEYDR